MEELVKIVKTKKLNLSKFMCDDEVCRIVEHWHTLAENECGEHFDYEEYLISCYNLVLENM
jgi:hypothetical protein